MNRIADPHSEVTETCFSMMRHARTVWNTEKRIQGQSDSPLTPKGEADARKWGKRLAHFSWDGILASDTGRARATAELINTSLKVTLFTDPRLREQDWGEWTGMTVQAVEALFKQMSDDQTGVGWRFCPPGGESRTRMWERGSRALMDAASRWPGAHLLVVTHEGMLRCILNRCLGREFTVAEPRLMRSRHLHQVVFTKDRLAARQVNAFDLRAKERPTQRADD